MARRTRVRRFDVLPPLSPAVYFRRPTQSLPFPLDEPGCALFERGRHALWHGLGLVDLRVGDEVIAPAYHDGSEIEALVRFGLICRFYEASEDLTPHEPELETLVTSNTRALYLIHYLGVPQDTARWRRWCDDKGLLLIEDVAQSWLATFGGSPVGSVGDLAIFCFYKSFGLPDGGALLSANPAAHAVARPPARLGLLAQRHAAWLAQRSLSFAAPISTFEPRGTDSQHEDFALGDIWSPPSAATRFLLARLDPAAAARRRSNYGVLLEELRDLVPPPFDQPPGGASPFALPIIAEHKMLVLENLTARGVRGLDLWPVAHPALPADEFPAAAARRATTVGLPVHQELSSHDLQRIASAVRPRRSRAPANLLQPIESLDAVQEEWPEIARSARNIFATWEWVSTWWRHFGESRPLLAAACRSADGKLIAILPLYLAMARPLRIVRFLGHGPGDQLGPICAPRDWRMAANLLRDLLADRRSTWDLFLGERLPGNEQWGAVLGGRVLTQEGTPLLRASGGWEQYLATRSAKLRKEVRRLERRLAEQYELRYRLADDPSRLESDLDTLFTLHGSRWSAGESSFAGAFQAFHRDFAAHALERGWLRLWFLELDGAPRAAWYGFRFEGVESFYNGGRDTAWDKASLGFLLVAHSIRAALDDGIQEYSFLRGGEFYKYRFADVDPGLQTIGVAHGIRGEIALGAIGAIGKKVPPTARRWLISD